MKSVNGTQRLLYNSMRAVPHACSTAWALQQYNDRGRKKAPSARTATPDVKPHVRPFVHAGMRPRR